MKAYLMNAILFLLTVASLLTTSCGQSEGPGPTAYSISGTVTIVGRPMGRVYISISGQLLGYTDSSGNYTVYGVPNGTYTVTPYKAELNFTPVDKSVTINGSNVVSVNFESQ